MGSRKIPQKFKLMILAVALFSLLAVQVVQGQTYAVEDSYAWTNYSNYDGIEDVYPADAGGFGQTFNASQGGYLYSFRCYLSRASGNDVILRAYLMGTGNVVSAVNATQYAISNTLDTSDYATGYQNYTFEFTGTYELIQYEVYALVVHVESGTISGANYLRVGVDGTSSTHEGRYVWYNTGAWAVAAAGSTDMVFEIYSQSISGLDTSTSGWSTGDTGELIEDFANFIVPIAVMLLPAILFIIFFKRTDKWLILIGLAIGTGLGYYFGMIPVWLVFLVAIGLIGLAYSEVRRNG